MHCALCLRCSFASPQVRANGLILFVPKYGIEGPVYFGRHPDDVAAASAGAGGAAQALARAKAKEEEWDLDEDAMVVRSRDGAAEYRVFQPCAVRIAVERSAVGNRERLVRMGSVNAPCLRAEGMRWLVVGGLTEHLSDGTILSVRCR